MLIGKLYQPALSVLVNLPSEIITNVLSKALICYKTIEEDW